MAAVIHQGPPATDALDHSREMMRNTAKSKVPPNATVRTMDSAEMAPKETDAEMGQTKDAEMGRTKHAGGMVHIPVNATEIMVNDRVTHQVVPATTVPILHLQTNLEIAINARL